ncbi:iron chelate uptake ABC transporter family permease subunit [Candidatus Woesearchaeota archaeon]|nr:iron chelate uptake ABC transporter family permease subunit [Candidatus Woesearchaeota archaeon]
MIDLLQYDFMRNAFISAVLVSIACGIVGTFVVVKKIVSLSGGIAHAAFGGIGLGYFLGFDPILTAIPFSLLSAIGIGTLNKKIRISEDSAIGLFWSFGMALGIIFIGLSPGYAPNLFSYLFGSILTVPVSEILIMVMLDIIIIACVLFFYKEFMAISFDEEFAEVAGLPTKKLNLLLLCLVGLSIIVMVRVVGIILIIALLTVPTLIAKKFTQRLSKLMILSTITASIFTICGLIISYLFDLASGATIVLVLVVVFGIVSVVRR